MIHINEFKELSNPNSLFAAYTWPQSELPKGQFIGRSGNALLMKNEDGYAVISAPKGETEFNIELPQVDLAWAF
jgi:hypothetical protein